MDEFDDTDGDLDPDGTDEDDDDDLYADGDDCGPTDPDVHPGAPEQCDGVDQDCDGDLVEVYTDTDGDGLPNCWDEDEDDDDASPDTVDCEPLEPAVWPGAAEVCDGLDNDCDGVIPTDEVDEDDDDSFECVDCDDDDDTVHPGAEELCDGLDNDCDGLGEPQCQRGPRRRHRQRPRGRRPGDPPERAALRPGHRLRRGSIERHAELALAPGASPRSPAALRGRRGPHHSFGFDSVRMPESEMIDQSSVEGVLGSASPRTWAATAASISPREMTDQSSVVGCVRSAPPRA